MYNPHSQTPTTRNRCNSHLRFGHTQRKLFWEEKINVSAFFGFMASFLYKKMAPFRIPCEKVIFFCCQWFFFPLKYNGTFSTYKCNILRIHSRKIQQWLHCGYCTPQLRTRKHSCTYYLNITFLLIALPDISVLSNMSVYSFDLHKNFRHFWLGIVVLVSMAKIGTIIWRKGNTFSKITKKIWIWIWIYFNPQGRLVATMVDCSL